MRDAHEIDEIMFGAMPSGAMDVASALRSSGFPCHAVGGCVRDSLMGREPHDWDMTTVATVDEMRESLHATGISTYDTGVAHGTITAVPSDGQPYEVTTYRVDGAYSDGRHPDRVTFTDSLEEDLARRDLTINAIAWSPEGGIVDPFGGVRDIASRTIRAVGVPTDRMCEDGLRVMRAIRFSATLGFEVEPKTDAAISSCVPMLDKVSWERKRDELEKMLSAGDPTTLAAVLRRHSDVIFAVIPELAPCVTTPQWHEWHRFDNVWDHTVEVVANAPAERCVRLAALLHDIGKPSCLEIHEDGRTSFLGHPAVSTSVAEEVLTRLRFDSKTIRHVVLLVREHDRQVAPTRKSVRRTIVRLGSEETFREWLSLRRADVMGQSEHAQSVELPRLAEVEALADSMMRDEGLFSMSDMLLRGQDLLDLGMSPGPVVGDILREAFDLVMDGSLPNERDALLEFAARRVAS